MHKNKPSFFQSLNNLFHFGKILSVFFIILLLMYWIQTIINAKWVWLGFSLPILEPLVNISSLICNASFLIFGATFEVKYIVAVIILIAIYYFFNFLMIVTEVTEEGCQKANYAYRRVEEKALNKKLATNIRNEELKINKFAVSIHTAPKSKFHVAHSLVDMDKLNQQMTEFIQKKLNKTPTPFEGGYIYYFNQFEQIDSVLEVLFKILNSQTALKYAICIQVDNNIEQLKRLANLRHYNQIVMAADTSFRYRYNKIRHYTTAQIGIFQFNDNTIEVHEFNNYL